MIANHQYSCLKLLLYLRDDRRFIDLFSLEAPERRLEDICTSLLHATWWSMKTSLSCNYTSTAAATEATTKRAFNYLVK
jgi:hypothetical protein